MQETYLFFKMSRYVLGSTQSPIWWLLKSPSSEVKQPGREVGHSLPPSAEVKNGESCISSFPIRLHGTYRYNFTFTRRGHISSYFGVRIKRLELSAADCNLTWGCKTASINIQCSVFWASHRALWTHNFWHLGSHHTAHYEHITSGT
jgi:hypothetical protein